MYVPKKFNSSSVPFSRKVFAVTVMFEGSKYLLHLEASTFPCGRVRLIARSSGFIVTGEPSNAFKDITFDSIRSLYTCPAFSVLTPSDVVYTICGCRPQPIY